MEDWKKLKARDAVRREGLCGPKTVITFNLSIWIKAIIARADREIACHWFISTTLRVYVFLEDHPEGSTVEPWYNEGPRNWQKLICLL